MGLWEGIKRGAKALVFGLGPRRWRAGGAPVVCRQCGNEQFIRGTVLMNSVGMTFAGFDWANKEATTLLCDECGLIDLYAIEPELVDG